MTNEVVTNRAGIVPSFFFNLDICTCDIVCVTCVCVCVCVVRGEGVAAYVRACLRHALVCFNDPSDGYCRRRNTEYPALSIALSFKK